ncbi:MAG: VOC family protein [Bacteroidota bacterium]
MKRFLFYSYLLFLSLILSTSIAAQSETTADSKVEEALEDISELPLVFRRTTLIVRNIEKSLALYRDIIGMEIIYDNTMKRPHPDDGRMQTLRLVFLKATHNFYGVLGLLEFDYQDAKKIPSPIRRTGFAEQNIVLLFNSANLETQFEQIKQLSDVEIISEPKLTQYPSYDGKSNIKVLVSKFYDPDGFLIEFNKLLD